MSDGLNLDGFATAKPAGKNNVAPQQYASDPKSAFPSTDKSSQDGAGLGNNGK
jgi:hypothetical protein